MHLLLCYFFVALECTSQWRGSDVAILIATIVLALVAAAAGMVGYRLWRRRPSRTGWIAAFNDPGEQTSLLLVVGILLDAISILAIAFAGVAPFFVPTCT